MPSLGWVLHDKRHAVLLGTLFVAATAALVGTSARHSLTISATSWTSIWLYTRYRGGSEKKNETNGQALSWAVGALLALASVCERAVEQGSILWAKSLLPALVYVILEADIFGEARFIASADTRHAQKPKNASGRLLGVATISALVALSQSSGVAVNFALGCCNAVLVAMVIPLLRRETAQSPSEEGASANGLLSQSTQRQGWTQILNQVSFAAALATWLAALMLEKFGTQPFGFLFIAEQTLMIVLGIGMVLVHAALNTSLVATIVTCEPISIASTLVAAALFAQLTSNFSLGRLWFAALYVVSLYSFLHDRANRHSSAEDRPAMRAKRLVSLLAVVSLALLGLSQSRDRLLEAFSQERPFDWTPLGHQESSPLEFNDSRVHPIEYLSQHAEAQFSSLLQRQSRTLDDAVTEYKRRYKIPPPPHFDKWFSFAKARNVQLIDEYDTIHDSLLPFWGLKPITIRRRVQEAIGFDGNNLIALLIRDGKASHVRSGQEWQQKATIGMMDKFIRYLPDMDLAFNIHDEPRVVVPHDELSRLVAAAKDKNMPAAFAKSGPRNSFSSRPKDLNAGNRVDEVKVTRFNVFAHQPTWIPSRLSCSPDSPARALEEEISEDDISSYAMTPLGFVHNATAFSDICNSPSFSSSHGFFDRPNAFNVVHDLIPIFSQSKMSSFQDILYPSPWYWDGKVSYHSGKDMSWDKKQGKLWWVGSTTGGFSRDGGWRRQHRQKLVTELNAPDQAKIMYDAQLTSATSATDTKPDWQMRSVPRSDYGSLIDVHFSHVGQCDPGDCDAQKEFFEIVPPADQQEAWNYKYLLDIDGNAFSGRFYAFLQSHSLVFKMAVFREWHAEWLKPWIHYVPMSLRAEEALESVRYFDAEEEGKRMAVEIAERGRDWASKVLRNDDFEVWFFRLLLEYGRLIDDKREEIGFNVPS